MSRAKSFAARNGATFFPCLYCLFLQSLQSAQPRRVSLYERLGPIKQKRLCMAGTQ